VDLPVRPKKGKRSAVEWEREHDPRFIGLRHRHSAVASAINASEAHGVDRCPDHGLDGFKHYGAFAVVARNLHRLGAVLLAAKAEQERREQRRAA
jgi:transposase, IS5 family